MQEKEYLDCKKKIYNFLLLIQIAFFNIILNHRFFAKYFNHRFIEFSFGQRKNVLERR